MKLKYLFPVFILFITSININAQTHNHLDDQREYAKAQIIDIIQKEIISDTEEPQYKTIFKLKILSGEYKDQVREIVFMSEDTLPEDVKYQKGDKIFIGITYTDYDGNSQENIALYDIDNSLPVYILTILVFLSIILIGRFKGFMSVVSLAITIFLLFAVFIPLVIKGFPPLPSALAICFISILITLPVIAGFKKKTLAAILGSSIGLTLAAILAVVFGNVLHVSGIASNELITAYYVSDITLDIKNLALSGMIISALGAIMDVAISIASSTQELYSANPNMEFKKAFSSVLSIGKDILGSMVNTLILAYVGSSISLILIISLKFNQGMPYSMIMNYNPVLTEIIKSLIGSIGMFLSIPATAAIAVHLYHKESFQKKNHIL